MQNDCNDFQFNINLLVEYFRCYETSRNAKYIFLEDLSIRGYENVYKYNGLNMNYMRATLKKLAMWHAATATLISKVNIVPFFVFC